MASTILDNSCISHVKRAVLLCFLSLSHFKIKCYMHFSEIRVNQDRMKRPGMTRYLQLYGLICPQIVTIQGRIQLSRPNISCCRNLEMVSTEFLVVAVTISIGPKFRHRQAQPFYGKQPVKATLTFLEP
jgi:hypothetical protein